MAYGLGFGKLAQTIDKPDETEIKIPATFRISESILASLNSIAKAIGVSKTEILNQVLEIGLTEFCQALESRTDLVVEVRDDAYPVFEFFAPAHARNIRSRFGDAIQLDLEDAIEEKEQQEKQQQEKKPYVQKPKQQPTKGKK
jgi:hypothetical protein